MSQKDYCQDYFSFIQRNLSFAAAAFQEPQRLQSFSLFSFLQISCSKVKRLFPAEVVAQWLIAGFPTTRPWV